VDAAGRCECAAGALRGQLSPDELRRLSAIFHAPAPPPALRLAGQTAVVVRATECDVYATAARRRQSFCVSHVKAGLLVCTSERPLPLLAPLVFQACEALRQ
jgi:hypothetical protein